MFDLVTRKLQSPDVLWGHKLRYEGGELETLRREAQWRAKEFLAKAERASYGVHPLGFLNVPLADSEKLRVRLHFWDTALFGPSSPYKIHDHSYGSYSIVLDGVLGHAVYTESSSVQRASFAVDVATPGSVTTHLERSSERLELALSTESNVGAGEAYFLARNVFHYAYATTPFVATLYFHLRHPGSNGSSRVAIPPNTQDSGPHGTFGYESLRGSDVVALGKRLDAWG